MTELDTPGVLSVSRAIAYWTNIHNDRTAAHCLKADGTIESISWQELESRTNRVARQYLGAGAQPSTMVAVGLPSSIEFLVAAIAILKIGAVPLPLSYKLPELELGEIVRLAKPSLVLGFEVGDIFSPSIPEGFTLPLPLDDGPLPDAVAPSWKAPTSGGSTGRPKVIQTTQPGIVDFSAPRVLNTPEGGTVVLGGPLYHNAPFHTAVQSLVRGLCVVLFERFDAERLLRAISDFRADSVLVVPTHMSRALRLPAEVRAHYDLASINQLWHSAAPCPEVVKQGWIDWIGAEKVYEMYGSSEGIATAVIRGDEWLTHKGSVGRVALGQMRILDPITKDEVPAGVVGEIYMRPGDAGGASFHYLGAVAETAGDGWTSVGDLGYFDEDEYLYIADRRADLIIAGGANIYPAEVENALQRHPAVATCAVIGLPDSDLGQRVHAVVQTDDPAISGGDLADFLGKHLVRYKIPRSFEIVAWDVRDDAGKVRRSALRLEREGRKTGN